MVWHDEGVTGSIFSEGQVHRLQPANGFDISQHASLHCISKDSFALFGWRKISQMCSVDLCATPPQVVPKFFGKSHMHHASARNKEVVRMNSLFGHRYLHVGRACLGRALMVVSIFFWSRSSDCDGGRGARTNDR